MCEDVRNSMIEKIDKKYGSLMRKIAHSILKDYHETEDVVQTVLWNLVARHMEKLSEENLKGYLCMAARNTAINLYNQKKGIDVTNPFVMYELIENRIDLATFQNEYGFGEELSALIKELDNIDKDIICMRYGWKHSYAEIAEAVGISEPNARKRAERALKKLQVMLLEKEVAGNDR